MLKLARCDFVQNDGIAPYGHEGPLITMNKLSATVAAVALSSSAIAHAGLDEDIRDAAKADLASLKAAGWPESRCSLSAYITDGGFIYGSSGVLEEGDQLVYLGDKNVEGQSAENIVNVLKGTAPDAVLTTRLKRSGEEIETSVPCENASMQQQQDLEILDLASRKKFPECVAAAQKYAARSSTAALMAYRCALAKNPGNYDMTSLGGRVLFSQITAARYDPALRPAAVKAIHEMRGIIGERNYAQAAEATTRWPGGEGLFEESMPDWARFRQNAERAVLVGFFDPASAIFEWPYGFTYGYWKPVLQGRIDGWWTCGRINAKNRMGGYVGSRFFVVVLNSDGQVVFTETGTGGNYDFVSMQCANSVGSLPPAPSQFFEPPASNKAETSGGTIADELAKLKGLFDSGALTEDEYLKAKAKVLGT